LQTVACGLLIKGHSVFCAWWLINSAFAAFFCDSVTIILTFIIIIIMMMMMNHVGMV